MNSEAFDRLYNKNDGRLTFKHKNCCEEYFCEIIVGYNVLGLKYYYVEMHIMDLEDGKSWGYEFYTRDYDSLFLSLDPYGISSDKTIWEFGDEE